VLKDQVKAIRLVNYFISHGVDPAQEDGLKQIPLFYATREGHNELIDLLVNNKSNVNHLDTYG
jgi:ankyrin repeat protein